MILDEMHFTYGSYNSHTHHLIFAHANTSRFMKIAGTIGSNTIFNKKDQSLSLISNDYDGYPVSMDLEIITECGDVIPVQNLRVIEKALFNAPEYKKLYIDPDDDADGYTYETIGGEVKSLYFNCRFINPERIEDGGGSVIGFKCTMECDTGLAIQDSITKTFSSPSTSVSIDVDTDTNEYTYPRVIIQTGSSGGDISIRNTTDDIARQVTRATQLKDIPASTTIIIDGRINFVTPQYYDSFYGGNFIRFLDGSNTINVTGDIASIKFIWNNKRYL